MAHDVFISYSAKDKPTADALCHALEAARVRCWMAPRDVVAGPGYGGQITHAIEASQAMVLLFSRHSNASTHVLSEVELAANARLHILNFRVDATPLSPDLRFFLQHRHWLDASPPGDRDYARLVEAVEALLKRVPIPVETPISQPPRRPPSSQKFLWMLAAVGLLAMAGFLLSLLSRSSETQRPTGSAASILPRPTESASARRPADAGAGKLIDLQAAAEVDASVQLSCDKLRAIARIRPQTSNDWHRYYSRTAIDIPFEEDGWKETAVLILLGTRACDAWVAINTEDAELLNKCVTEIEAAAKRLAIPGQALAHAATLHAAANSGRWLDAYSELLELQRSLNTFLYTNKDPTKVSLVSLGGWVQGMRYTSDVVRNNYTPERSNCLRDPKSAGDLLSDFNIESMFNVPLSNTAEILSSLVEIKKIVSIEPDGSIPIERVNRLHDLATNVVRLVMKSYSSK